MASDLNTNLANGIYSGVAIYHGIKIQESSGSSGSDTRSSGQATRTFRVWGSFDPVVCKQALYDGPVPINNYDGKNLERVDWDRVGPQDWEFTLSYNATTPNIGGYTISVDSTGGQVLQTYAYAQSSYAATGETAIDYGNAIDVQDNKPQGVQRVIQTMKINVRAKIASQWITGGPVAYAKLMSDLTGYTNSQAMFGGQFAQGELLFIGGTGDVVGDNPELTFSFMAGKNLSSLTIGDITGITKKAHDYLWFDYKTAEDATAKRTISQIRAAYVGRIYGEADLSQLQIGVAPT
jgi:hypothetical protein